MNWLKRLFCKKETRVLYWDDSKKNAILANRLSYAVANGGLKEYKNVLAFIDKYSNESIQDRDITVKFTTPEIERLKVTWNILQYKCKDVDLIEFMK